MNEQDRNLEKLKHVLEACGADAVHWPDDQRDRLITLVDTNLTARELMDQARAFDEVLGAAPVMQNTDALKARILETAINTRPDTAAKVIVLSEARFNRSAKNRHWGAAALLAASLALGIWTGASGIADTLVSAPLTIAGLESVDDLDDYYKSGLSAAEDLL